MRRSFPIFLLLAGIAAAASAQSGKSPRYSESVPTLEPDRRTERRADRRQPEDEDTIRVDTDLIVVPTIVRDRNGRAVTDISKQEFRVFEDGKEQEIAYFEAGDQPVTVALLLDTSYSSLFKLTEIQAAALRFIDLLRPDDRVMIVAFDEKVRVLCKPTDNRYALRLAVEAVRVGSGTSVYSAIEETLARHLSGIKGRKAIVLLSDGVDTTSAGPTPDSLLSLASETDSVVYSIRYDTFGDVQKSRQNQAEIRYDENDRPYQVLKPRAKGEREEDYRTADEFLRSLSVQTGGRLIDVRSAGNVREAFSQIADELRRVYGLGYYPSGDRQVGVRYAIKVRVYRPDLVVRARNGYEIAAGRR